MSREKIEEKDQRLIKKIREIIDNKEKKTGKKKPVCQTYKFWLPILCAGFIIACLIIFKEQPATIVSNNSEPTSRSEKISENTFKTKTTSILKKITDQNAVTDTEDMVQAAKPLEQSNPPASKKNMPPEKETVSQKTATKPSEALLTPDRSKKIRATAQSTLTEKSHMPSSIQIHEMVSCSSISQKQYVCAKTVFSLKEESTPVVWMTVLADNPPFTLTHVYYINGRRYCEVPLSIRYHRMRTWSNVTLNHPDHAGKWRVEVMTENGEKLKHIEFTVVE